MHDRPERRRTFALGIGLNEIKEQGDDSVFIGCAPEHLPGGVIKEGEVILGKLNVTQMFADLQAKLVATIDDLRRRVEELECAPGGPRYLEAEARFNRLAISASAQVNIDGFD